MPETHTKNGHKKKCSFLHIAELSQLPYTTLFLIWIGLAVGFACVYFALSSYAPEHGPSFLVGLPPHIRFFDALYYSIITATSTGYGDITPRGISKAFAAIQSISALFIFAMFVTKLVSQRQDMALQEVHKLSFEDIFHNIRGDLFIIRKDLEALQLEARNSKQLNEDAWETLTIAYQQAQSILNEIPDFYDGGNSSYTIDDKREVLLLEAVHRTLHRINSTLDVFSQEGIDWMQHELSFQELQELLRVIQRIGPLWEERSPYDKREAFEGILTMASRTHNRVMSAL